MKNQTDSAFVATLEDNIHKHGAMDKLISDHAQTEISCKTKDILRTYCINDWQSEPYHQHQNLAEGHWRTIKNKTNVTLDCTGAPACTWLLCIMWVIFIMNHMACAELGYRTPIKALTGSTPNISAMLEFGFWDLVYYCLEDHGFLSESGEHLAHVVSIANNVGDALTYKLLDCETEKIIYWSTIHSADITDEQNCRILPDDGEQSADVPEIVKTVTPTPGFSSNLKQFDPSQIDELIGHTYLMDPDSDDSVFCTRIVSTIDEFEARCKCNPEYLKFLIKYDDENKSDEIVAYNDIICFITQEADDMSDQFWKFKHILGHQGPFLVGQQGYNSCKWNVQVE